MLVELKDIDGDKLWLNPEFITRIMPAEGDFCAVSCSWMPDMDTDFIYLAERPEDVAAKVLRAMGYTSLDAIGFVTELSSEEEIDSYGD